MISLKTCRYTLPAVIALQPLWFFWLSPPEIMPPWLATAVMSLPLLPTLPGVWLLKKRPLVIAGCILLLHFCLAVSEAWVSPAARVPALIQIGLIVLYVTGLSALRWGRQAP
ncbi:DUF2069 domain-containing protein [Wenzhouxiangella sp. XN201]|uniref:DUF2069 domain-containing protein n=1 Tax=Wenzhouxiangella sp. XN201 TaxID=2710755 RepID=UPI0013CDD25A|nr:DUF2069 domain-containing protein [Wenzhouxiangella sp. XN201]NEZ04531.1 DUF2069 domain-containing protein [Wenzhouxiangella sp. XN201]